MSMLPDYIQGLAVLLACTAFVKIATVLSIARYGLGLYDFVFGGVVIIAAVVLAVLVAEPLIDSMPDNQKLSVQVAHFENFLTKNTDPEVRQKLGEIVQTKRAASLPESEASPDRSSSSGLLVASFIISELREAFKVGLMLLVPFIVIDLLVMNVLMLLGVTQISVLVIALPLKLLLFISVDGWSLISEKLLSSYFS